MAHLTADQVRELMSRSEHIRNLSVVGLRDHGKSAVLDSLISTAGVMLSVPVSERRYYDYRRDDDQDRRLIAKLPEVLLHYEHPEVQSLLFNVVDAPQFLENYGEASAILKGCDGALVVIDSTIGVIEQTNSIFRQLLLDRIKPVVFFNKIDRLLLELQLDNEAIYSILCGFVEKVNASIGAVDSGVMGELSVHPCKGNLAFGSGIMGWGFTLRDFARLYADKCVDEAVMKSRLWGENYYDEETKKWQNHNVSGSGKTLQPSFCVLVLQPIRKMLKACMDNDLEALDKMLGKIGLKLKPEERELQGRRLAKIAMKKWLPISDSLLQMIALHLPSPVQAAKYRIEILYEGPMDDLCATAMRNCDSSGPLMLYISRMVPSSDKGRFFAFGRVFSGTVATAQKVRILGPNYKVGHKEDLYVKTIQRTLFGWSKVIESVIDVPAGNFVAVVGVDAYLVKTGTVTTCEEAHCIRTPKFPLLPVLNVSVTIKNPAELPKLVDGLRRLAKCDAFAQCTATENGDHIIAGCSEAHLTMCVESLQQEYAMVEIVKSQPFVTYRETITQQSTRICMSKSPNKHNRLYCVAVPLGEGLTRDIETGKIKSTEDKKLIAQKMSEEYGWELNDARKIWSYAPDENGPNILVDATIGVSSINEIKDSMSSAFQWAIREGPMCEENVRGLRINLLDVCLCSDAIHRGGGQIIPTARRVFYGSQLTAKPALLEPVYLIEITTAEESVEGVYQCLAASRGVVLSEDPIPGTTLLLVTCYLPVAESLGFPSALQSLTSDTPSYQCIFDHWQVVPGDPLDPQSTAGEIVRGIRRRKGISEEIPPLERFLDTL